MEDEFYSLHGSQERKERESQKEGSLDKITLVKNILRDALQL